MNSTKNPTNEIKFTPSYKIIDLMKNLDKEYGINESLDRLNLGIEFNFDGEVYKDFLANLTLTATTK